MNKRLKQRGIYHIFNNIDFTNDHMLELLTKELAKKAEIYFNRFDKQLVFNDLNKN